MAIDKFRVLDVWVFLLALNISEGVAIWTKWKVNIVVNILFPQVIIALLYTATTFTVENMLHDFCVRETEKVELQINFLLGQHIAKP